MVAFNFQSRFADAVESGEKRQTIRAARKDGRVQARWRHALQLYVGHASPSVAGLLRDARLLHRCQVVRRSRCCRRLNHDQRSAMDWAVHENHALALGRRVQEATGQKWWKWFTKTHGGLPFSRLA